MEKEIEILLTIHEYLGKFIPGTLQAAEYFQSGQEYKGFQTVSFIADGALWLVEALELTRQVQEEKIWTVDIIEIINEINEAMQNKDTVSLADLLEYEITPILQKWQLIIQKSLKLN